MAEIRDTLRLDIDEALRQVDQVGRRLESALQTDVEIDSRSAEVLASALRTAEQAAATLRGETDATSEAAARSERSYRDLATALGVSEQRAAALSSEAKEAAQRASDLEREARQIADSMGLSESETRQFVSSLRAADRAAGGVSDATGRISRTLGGLRTLALGAVGGFIGFQTIEGLVRGAGSAVGAYSDSVEEASKASVVFGDSIRNVNEFVAESASTLRASRTEATQATAAFGTFFRGLGFAESAAADLSIQTVQLGADLASFNNLDFTEALDKLRSGLAGETEPLGQLGAKFNEAELKAKALELGLGGLTGELSEQEKVAARLALITERTATAQGDAARTSDQLAGRLRSAQAAAKDLAPEFGAALLPAIETLLDVAPLLIASLEELVPVVQDLAEGFADAAPEIVDFAERLPAVVSQVGSLGRFLRDVAQAGQGASGVFTNLGQAAVSLASADFGGVADQLGEVRESFRQLNEEGSDIKIDLALRAINNGLNQGLDPAVAYATAIRDMGNVANLTTDDLDNLAKTAGLEDVDLTTLENLAATIGTLGLEPGQADAIVADIRRVQNAVLSQQFADSDELFGVQGFEGARRRIVETAEAAEQAATPLGLLRGAAAEAETSFLDFATAAATANTGVLDSLSSSEQILGALQLIGEAAVDAAAQYRDSFDVILTETNKKGDEVPRSVEQLVDDFEEQAQRLTDFQATIATLTLRGFDDLATRLQQEGPAALEAGLGFLDDIDAATRAERALEGQGVEIAGKIEEDLEDAIAGADFADIGTQVGLGIAEGLTSPAVLSALRSSATRVANSLETFTKGALQVQSPSKVFMRIGEFVGEGLVIGFSEVANRRVPVLQNVQFPDLSAQAGGIARGGGGAGTVNNVNVSNTVTLAGGDRRFAAAVQSQQLAATGAALRGARLGTLRG